MEVLQLESLLRSDVSSHIKDKTEDQFRRLVKTILKLNDNDNEITLQELDQITKNIERETFDCMIITGMAQKFINGEVKVIHE